MLINKALIEIPPKFAGCPPVNPEASKTLLESDWRGALGLADDISYYGKWLRDEAEHRIGHLYPKLKLPKEYGGGETTMIAWLWTRTVKCPNPACRIETPLLSSFVLSNKKGIKILKHLADGIDPYTGEVFPEDSPYQHPQTVRAIFNAVMVLEGIKDNHSDVDKGPANAGKSWEPDEGKQLKASFDSGMSIKDLAHKHQRTSGAIQSRLIRLGKFVI